jgi:hypothetical protein
MMDWRFTFLDELQRMKEKMDRTWGELFEGNPSREQEVSQWIERLPKFEGQEGLQNREQTKLLSHSK